MTSILSRNSEMALFQRWSPEWFVLDFDFMARFSCNASCCCFSPSFGSNICAALADVLFSQFFFQNQHYWVIPRCFDGVILTEKAFWHIGKRLVICMLLCYNRYTTAQPPVQVEPPHTFLTSSPESPIWFWELLSFMGWLPPSVGKCNRLKILLTHRPTPKHERRDKPAFQQKEKAAGENMTEFFLQ